MVLIAQHKHEIVLDSVKKWENPAKHDQVRQSSASDEEAYDQADMIW